MAKIDAKEPSLSLRDKILHSAVLEFGEKGFAGARMDEIAQASGASKQVLYHHFASKEGLFEAALQQAYAEFRGSDESLRRKVAELNPEAALNVFVEHLFTPSVEAVRFQRLIHDENRFEASHVRKMADVKGMYDRLIGIITEILERGAAEGVFRADLDPIQVYVSLAGLFMFRITNAFTLSVLLGIELDTKAGARASREEAMQLILRALRRDLGGKETLDATNPRR